MQLNKQLFLLIAAIHSIIGFAVGSLEHEKVIVCYLSSWATYRPSPAQFNIDHIDPELCTHLVYAFAGLDTSTFRIRSLDPYNDLEEDYGKGSYKKMTSLRSKYPNLKVTLAIGGWNEGSSNYSILAASPDKRRVFISSVVEFINKSNFNGLDLDWEFPGKRGGKPQDKQNFVTLVKELRTEFDHHGWILTAALGAGKETIDTAYDVLELSRYLDFLHLMAYDYHGSWDKKAGANAPLAAHDKQDMLTVEASVEYMLKLGVEPSKLVLGLPMYGRTFILQDEGKGAKLGFAASDVGFPGPLTRENGFMGYNEICSELKRAESGWSEHWDNETSTPFATYGSKLISYDNAKSIKLKVLYATRRHLAGVMIWSIDTDDFHGTCGTGHHAEDGSYPLLKAVNSGIKESLAIVLLEEEKDRTKNRNKEEDIDNSLGKGNATKVSSRLTIFTFLICSQILNSLLRL